VPGIKGPALAYGDFLDPTPHADEKEHGGNDHEKNSRQVISACIYQVPVEPFSIGQPSRKKQDGKQDQQDEEGACLSGVVNLSRIFKVQQGFIMQLGLPFLVNAQLGCGDDGIEENEDARPYLVQGIQPGGTEEGLDDEDQQGDDHEIACCRQVKREGCEEAHGNFTETDVCTADLSKIIQDKDQPVEGEKQDPEEDLPEEREDRSGHQVETNR
jgi:hypothetical protein